jgi:hypothetical protein
VLSFDKLADAVRRNRTPSKKLLRHPIEVSTIVRVGVDKGGVDFYGAAW